MKNFYKNLLAGLGAVVLVALIIFLLASTNQKVNTAITTNTISFSGEGKVSAKPDIAKLEFAVVTQAQTSKEAQNANSPKSKAVVDFLRKQGVEEKDIKTLSYNVYPQYNYPRFDAPEIKGYEVIQKFEVKIRDLDKTNEILDRLVTAGANNIANVAFTIDEPEKLQAEARVKAIADAKKKARDLEKQLGVNLGKIVNFSENTGGFPGPYYLEAKNFGQGGVGGGAPEIPVGENETVVNVTITYQIK